ncbi:MAG: SDR family oxidoreductase [Rhodothermales bacterium]
MDTFLSQRVVVVTGAGGRLAGYMLHALSDAGATLAAVERPGRAGALPAGAAGGFHQADVSREAGVVDVFAEIVAAYGRIDALIHTVGSWDGRPLTETSLAQWNGQIEANLTTAFLCMREAVRHMRGAGGRIVGIASAQGADRGVAEQAAYSASKAGVVRLIEAIAAEHRPDGIHAFALAPSMILYDGAGGAGVRAEQLAGLCLDLLRPEAAAMSGSVLRAYGDA